MKRTGLILLTLMQVLLTGVVLTQSQWFGQHGIELSARQDNRREDPYASAAAYRLRHNQPSHWRSFVMQH